MGPGTVTVTVTALFSWLSIITVSQPVVLTSWPDDHFGCVDVFGGYVDCCQQILEYKHYLANVAMKSTCRSFEELLPPSAYANLQYLYSLPWVQEALSRNEVAANLDQCPTFQEHAGIHMPVILASISHMCLELGLLTTFIFSFFCCEVVAVDALFLNVSMIFNVLFVLFFKSVLFCSGMLWRPKGRTLQMSFSWRRWCQCTNVCGRHQGSRHNQLTSPTSLSRQNDVWRETALIKLVQQPLERMRLLTCSRFDFELDQPDLQNTDPRWWWVDQMMISAFGLPVTVQLCFVIQIYTAMVTAQYIRE